MVRLTKNTGFEAADQNITVAMTTGVGGKASFLITPKYADYSDPTTPTPQETDDRAALLLSIQTSTYTITRNDTVSLGSTTTTFQMVASTTSLGVTTYAPSGPVANMAIDTFALNGPQTLTGEISSLTDGREYVFSFKRRDTSGTLKDTVAVELLRIL